ncbi:MAG: 3-methylfumaryl-CoA hydratase [Paraglaciecola psychrophila]|jgi:3-methylfumaryl-CoA hydratase
MSEEIAIDHLRSWIGKQDRHSDTITAELLKRYQATLSAYTDLSQELPAQLPLGIHWCLAQPAISAEGLGADGHPAKGGFMPPVPLPRRMWAASSVRFHHSPAIDVAIERTSTITDVVLKHSAQSGPLVFVHVDHLYRQDNRTVIEDRQTIVYRQLAAYQAAPAQAMPRAAHAITVTPDNILLFRYSGITFNSHRIHYDQHYTTTEEGYPGLVVQGPMMASMLMNLAQASRPKEPLRRFEFRGLAPAFVDQDLRLAVIDKGTEDECSLDIRNNNGALIQSASARFTADGQ